MHLTPQTRTAAGVALIVAGAWILHQRYEGKGRRRPFLLNFVPG